MTQFPLSPRFVLCVESTRAKSKPDVVVGIWRRLAAGSDQLRPTVARITIPGHMASSIARAIQEAAA